MIDIYHVNLVEKSAMTGIVWNGLYKEIEIQ